MTDTTIDGALSSPAAAAPQTPALPAPAAARTGALSWATGALLMALIADAAWIVRSPANLQAEWGGAIVILLVLCGVAGYLVNNRVIGILIDDRHRLSLGRLQWAVWFIILFSAYFVVAILDSQNGQALPKMDPTLFGLLGIVTGSAVVGGLIVDTKKSAPQGDSAQSQGSIDRNDGPHEASWADLYLGEEVANRGTVDVGRLQQLVLTLLLAIVYAQSVWNALGSNAPELPVVGQTFLGLLAASHGGYLATKAMPKTAATPTADQ